MIHDAKVEVTCDGERCRENLFIDLPFMHPDYSGKGGRYDHRPHVVNPKVEREGWTVVSADRHLCWACAESDAEQNAPSLDVATGRGVG